MSWSQPNRGHDTRNCLKRKILAPGIQICLVLFARHVEILQKKRRHHIRTKSAQEPSLSFYRLSLKSILALTQPVSSPRFETRLRARGTPPKKKTERSAPCEKGSSLVDWWDPENGSSMLFDHLFLTFFD